MTEQKCAITITKDAFKAEPGVRTLLPLVRALNNLTQPSLKVRTILDKKPISEGIILEKSPLVNQNVANLFDFNECGSPDTVILDQLKKANEVIDYIKNHLGFTAKQLHDEVYLPDPLILRSAYTYLHRSNVDPMLAYELRRQLLLGILSSDIYTRTAKDKSYEFLSEMQNTLNENFFYHNKQEKIFIGSTQQKMFITTHNPYTNEALDIEATVEPRELSENKKLVRGRFRKVQLDDDSIVDVYSSDRKKSTVISIIKAIAKANGGSINPVHEIEDSIGKQLVVNGSNEIRDKVLEKYIAVMKKQYPNMWVEIDDPHKDEPGEVHRGQSGKIDFKRVKLHFNGKSAYYEVICFSLLDFINSKLEIGNIKNGVYDGQAHELYELRRLVKVAEILFPPEFYDDDVDSLANKRSEEIVYRLRSMEEVNME